MDVRRLFIVGRTFLSDHFAGRNARVTSLRPKRLTLRVAVANLRGKQNIKMAFSQFAELWKLIDVLVRKDFRQANLAYALEGEADCFDDTGVRTILRNWIGRFIEIVQPITSDTVETSLARICRLQHILAEALKIQE